LSDDPAATAASERVFEIGPLENRFHVVSVACRRVMQIRTGSRPRLDPHGHKPCIVAVAEVMAGTVPYYVS
jgi:DNA-directed RNA polymerase subunit K/omega